MNKSIKKSVLILLFLFLAVLSCAHKRSIVSDRKTKLNAEQNSANTETTTNACSEKEINKDAVQNYLKTQNVAQTVLIPKVPKKASFAGEEVPLEYFDVYESLQRELSTLTYQHGTIIYIAQLNGRYKEKVTKILKECGIPEDFYYLCIAESMLQPLTSPVGAKGYWQFMPSTAKEFGLEVTSEVDERYNWEKSTRAAAEYFKMAYEKYGTWTLAAASYNIGMANVDERVELQSIKNYYDMQFPLETARYVFRAIAYKEILNNLEKYGFYLSKDEIYKPIKTKTVKVSGPVENWSVWAAENGTNFKMVKKLNEWIRLNQLKNADNKIYFVEVPNNNSRKR